jgi:hypothetical protein
MKVVILDSGCLESVELEDIVKHPSQYFTTTGVLEEVHRWMERESKNQIFDSDLGQFRKGFDTFEDSRDELGLEEALEHCKLLPGKIQAKARLYEQAKHVHNYFSSHPDQVIRNKPHDLDAESQVTPYTQLLSKRIVAEVASHNLRLVKSRDYKPLAELCLRRYNDLLASFGVADHVTKFRQNEARASFLPLLERLNDSRSSPERVVEKYSGLKNDLAVVVAAFYSPFVSREVMIYTRDRDVAELVDYVKAAQYTGNVTIKNHVSCGVVQKGKNILAA